MILWLMNMGFAGGGATPSVSGQYWNRISLTIGLGL